MRYLKLGLMAFLSLGLLVSCASTTTLKSNVSGAKFYADGQFIGEGAVVYSDKKIVGSSTVIEVKKDGYKDKSAVISRSNGVNVGALVGGILFAPTIVGLLFFLWVTDYSPYHAFELEPVGK